MSDSVDKSKKKLRLLCMHGFGTNREFMKMQTQALAAELQKETELIHIDAPYVVPKELVFDEVVFKYLKGPPRSWFGPKLSIGFTEVDKARRHQDVLDNLEQIRLAIEKEGVQFDGAICFSQGSMAFQLVYLYHKLGHIKWEWFCNIKFLMNFSSVSARISLGSVNWERFSMPSLHILSEEDVFFQTMMVTPTRFKNAKLIMHSFGHKFPALGMTQKRTILAFMKQHGHGQNTFDISKESRL